MVKKFLIAIFALSVLVTGGYFAGSTYARHTSAGSACEWIMYDTEGTLTDAANLIIKGTVEKVYPSTEIKMADVINKSTGKTDPLMMLYTVSDIRVTKVYKGTAKAGDIVRVKQWGGRDVSPAFSVQNVEYYTQNDKHIFFLEAYTDGTPASPMNGLQGDIKIVNETVKIRDPKKLFSQYRTENSLDDFLSTSLGIVNNK